MKKIEFANVNYFAQIPYYVLFCQGISVNELIFYSFIHRYEHDPDPSKQAFFSFAWVAFQLDIDVRSAKRIAKKLKEKGFITRKQIRAKWIWNTSRFQVVIQDDLVMTEDVTQNDEEKGVTQPVTPEVTQPVTPPVTERVTHIQKETNDKETTSSGSDFSDSQEEVIIGKDADAMLWRENLGKPCATTDKIEFLKWCRFWLANECKVKDEPGKLRVLMSIIRKGGLSKPKGFSDGLSSTPSKPISDDEFKYRDYLGVLAGDIKWGRFPEDYKRPSLKEWIDMGSPSRPKLS